MANVSTTIWLIVLALMGAIFALIMAYTLVALIGYCWYTIRMEIKHGKKNDRNE